MRSRHAVSPPYFGPSLLGRFAKNHKVDVGSLGGIAACPQADQCEGHDIGLRFGPSGDSVDGRVLLAAMGMGHQRGHPMLLEWLAVVLKPLP
jgi:hypothetical protein